MNLVLSTFQAVLALHTAVGAVWKWSNGEQTMPSLAAIPHGIWLSLSVVELICAIALIVPIVTQRGASLVPIAATVVGAEMLLFSGVHLASGSAIFGPVIYWLVVAAICTFIVYGRLVLKPVRRGDFA